MVVTRTELRSVLLLLCVAWASGAHGGMHDANACADDEAAFSQAAGGSCAMSKTFGCCVDCGAQYATFRDLTRQHCRATCGLCTAPAPIPSCTCTNTCKYSNDGSCEDGGPGKRFGICALGTDCADCGPSTRTSLAAGESCPGAAPAPASPPASEEAPKAKCSSQRYATNFCGTGNVYDESQADTECAGAACAANIDAAKCCKASQPPAEGSLGSLRDIGDALGLSAEQEDSIEDALGLNQDEAVVGTDSETANAEVGEQRPGESGPDSSAPGAMEGARSLASSAVLVGVAFRELTMQMLDDIKAGIQMSLYTSAPTGAVPIVDAEFSRVIPPGGTLRLLREHPHRRRRLLEGDTRVDWVATYNSPEDMQTAARLIGDGTKFTAALKADLNDDPSFLEVGVAVSEISATEISPSTKIAEKKEKLPGLIGITVSDPAEEAVAGSSAPAEGGGGAGTFFFLVVLLGTCGGAGYMYWVFVIKKDDLEGDSDSDSDSDSDEKGGVHDVDDSDANGEDDKAPPAPQRSSAPPPPPSNATKTPSPPTNKGTEGAADGGTEVNTKANEVAF